MNVPRGEKKNKQIELPRQTEINMKKYNSLQYAITLLMILLGSIIPHDLDGQNPDPNFHLYLLVGQSNMAGRGAVDSLSTPFNPFIMMLNEKNEREVARDPLNFDKPDVCGVGPGLAFVQKLPIVVPFSAVATSEGLLHKGDDFSVKGFHLDLRAEVMTMPALKAFASELAQFGINTLVMEWEATFPYNENAIISNRNSYKPGEVRDFIAHCTSLGIDVIPIHHCFGHAEWILRHERYRHICEDSKEISQVCPMKVEEAIPIFRSLFKEMADYHPSPYFHIGGDETYLLGSCPLCREKVEKEGKSKLFVDYVKAMCDIVTEMGKIPVLWADIILKYPEAIAEMPKNAIYVDWNYGWQINRFGDMNKLYKAGATMWGAPSIRSNPDNMYLTNWLTHFNNQRDFIPYSREAGYEGIIMTSWSTSGQYSLLYEPRWEVQDIEPIRNVYPLNGFRILLAAYAKSLQQVEPLDPSSFVKEYAVARFGLTEEEGQVFWQVLSEKQELVKLWKNTNGLPATQLLQQATSQRDRLYAMRPRKNRTEFEHFKLMFDIRVSYLKGKELEADYQSENYNRSQAKDLLKRVEAIIQEEKKLDKRFTELQKGFLTDSEINHLNTIRKHKLYLLKDFLAQQARD